MSYTITPQSTIHFVKTKLEKDYEHTLDFANKQAQTNFFNNLVSVDVSYNDFTYVKKDGYVTIPKPLDQMLSYNYLFYENNGFPNSKRYYCFITKMEYVSENDTRVYFETDVIQTYLFDLTWNNTFVEREHTSSDGLGEHTIDERLDTGEYIINGSNNGVTIKSLVSSNPATGSPNLDLCCVVAGITFDVSNMSSSSSYDGGGTYGGVYSGLTYITFPNSVDVIAFIKESATYSKSDGIQTLFMCPKLLTGIDPSNWETSSRWQNYTGTYNFRYYKCEKTTNYTRFTEPSIEISVPTSIDGYTPKNNKVLCYPYNYLYCTNFNGAENVFKYELFNLNQVTPNCTFHINGVLSPSCSISMVSLNYQVENSTNNQMFAIPCGKFPQCSWDKDEYTNWLVSNGANRIVSYLTGSATAILGATAIATGAGAVVGGGMIIGGVSTIGNTIAQGIQHSLVPNSAKGTTNNGDILFASGVLGYGFYKMSIKQETARVIDNYFQMYGYKVNRVKVPNLRSRRYWNFIKTIKCNVEGDIPQEDLEKIREICDKGITFWHNNSIMFNYNLTNSIV